MERRGICFNLLSFFFRQTFNFEIDSHAFVRHTIGRACFNLFPSGNILETLVEDHNQDMDRDTLKIQNVSLPKCTTRDFIFVRVW